MNPAFEFVRYALSIGALELVPNLRRLKSGRLSPYFFNSGLFCTGSTITMLAKAYVGAIWKDFSPDVIFGPSYKGSAIAVAVVQCHGGDVEYAYNRKEAKDHGEGGIIIGASLKGKKVVLVDDVMTSGGSLAEAVDIVRTAGGNPIGCAIAFDRQECGRDSKFSAVQDFESRYDIPVLAAATFADLIGVVQASDNDISFILPQLLEYKKEWGV